jgi:excisionase family DNA binding protein
LSEVRFHKLDDIADILNISASQAYALVRSGDLPGIKIGGRGQWRVEQAEFDKYLQRVRTETQQWIKDHPLGRNETPTLD